MVRTSTPTLGILLVNLGSPQTATRRGVAEFLRPFLLDRRVVELPHLLWWPLLNGLVIPLRAGRVAKAYESIWTASGSPLRSHTQNLALQLQDALAGENAGDPANPEHPERVKVRWAMTYGDPGIAETLQQLLGEGVERTLVVPLFPQYSATTTGPVYDQLADFVKRQRNIPDLRVVRNYPDFPAYISALAESVRAHWRVHGRGERLLMSFHGIPKRCAELGDPYPEDCERTGRALARALDLQPGDWQIAFQSRFGRQEWLRPYTDETLRGWAHAGVGCVDVICPAFAADCLETLEEIAVQGDELLRASGGRVLRLIPCLNDSAEHVMALRALIEEHC